MFICSRESLLLFVERMQEQSCTYFGPTCDCKYGLDPTRPRRPGSEQSGCPEYRALALLLRGMTDEEYVEVCERSGGIDVTKLFFKEVRNEDAVSDAGDPGLG